MLNNYSGFYSRKVYVNEVRKTGANICLPEINKSFYKTVIYGNNIYLDFDGILNLEIGLKQFVMLICCGSFRKFNPNKKELLWEAHLLLNGRSGAVSSPALFETDSKKIVLPKLETSVLEDLYDEIELRRKIREVNNSDSNIFFNFSL